MPENKKETKETKNKVEENKKSASSVDKGKKEVKKQETKEKLENKPEDKKADKKETKSAADIAKQAAKKAKEQKKDSKNENKSFSFGKKKKPPVLVDVKKKKKDIKKKRLSGARQRHMQKSRKIMLKRAVGCIAFMAVLAFVIITGFQVAGALQPNAGLAARVDSYEIKESDVTNYINHQSLYANYKNSPSNWAKYLSMYGKTPADIRTQILQEVFEKNEITRRACAEKENIEVTEDEIQAHIKSLRDKFSSDKNYQDGLSKMGYTEDSYYEYTKTKTLEEKLKEKVAPKTDPTDADMVSYMTTNKSTYNNAKRSSHILFGLGDKEKAQQVLDQLNAGTLTWDSAVIQYSTDENSKSKGGDIGWDKCNTYKSGYTTGLGKVENGKISSELCQSDDGYHIIKVTDEWKAPDSITSVSQVPTDILNYAKDKKKDEAQTETFNNYINDFKTQFNVVIEEYEIPSGLPYNIDMAKYNKSSSTTSSSSSSTDDN